MQHYKVTKYFVSGLLQGLTIEESSSFSRPVSDKIYSGLGSPYIITACVTIPEKASCRLVSV